MLREVLEDALDRGERLKKDIVAQVLSSAVLNDLIKSPRFSEMVSRAIQTRESLSKVVHKNVREILKMMKIPNQKQIADYERRVRDLEKLLDRFSQRLLAKGIKKKTSRHRKK